MGRAVPVTQLESWLRVDIQVSHRAAMDAIRVMRLCSYPTAIDVFTSMSFQLGQYWASKWSTVVALIRDRQINEAISAIRKSGWYRQTPLRANDVIDFLKQVASAENIALVTLPAPRVSAPRRRR